MVEKSCKNIYDGQVRGWLSGGVGYDGFYNRAGQNNFAFFKRNKTHGRNKIIYSFVIV